MASEDDADDDLPEEQQKEGYGKIAKIHGIKARKAAARSRRRGTRRRLRLLRRLDRPATHHF